MTPLSPKTSALLFLVLILALASFGCSSNEPPGQQSTPLPLIVQDGISIPHQANAMDQLNYARSGLRDKKVKMAAFRAVSFLFPNDRLECAHAALGLAYLHLEPQHRFATPLDIRQAVNDFSSVLTDFPDLPDIQAKALWYLGWIHTDLLDAPDQGIAFYWRVVREYPDVPMNLSPTVPWITLVYSDNPVKKQLKPSAPKKFWSQVALLEIVKNSRKSDEVLSAFHLLIAHHFTTQATGLAIRHLLSVPALADHARPQVASYLLRNPGNPYLAKDIRTLSAGEGS